MHNFIFSKEMRYQTRNFHLCNSFYKSSFISLAIWRESLHSLSQQPRYGKEKCAEKALTKGIV